MPSIPVYFCDRCDAPSHGSVLCRSCNAGAQQAAAADAATAATSAFEWRRRREIARARQILESRR